MKLTPDQTDLLGEVMNVGIGRAAHALSELVRARVVLQVPKVEVGHVIELEARWREKAADGLSLVSQDFDGASSGVAVLAFETPSARALVSLLVGSEDEDGIDAEREAVLLEVGNIMINGVMGAFGNIVARDIAFDLPAYSDGDIFAVLPVADAEAVIVDVVLGIAEHCIEGQLAVVFDRRTLENLWPLLEGDASGSSARA